MEGQTDKMDVDHSQEEDGGGKREGEGAEGGEIRGFEGTKVG